MWHFPEACFVALPLLPLLLALFSGAEVAAQPLRLGEQAAELRGNFERDGFIVLRSALSKEVVQACRQYFEEVVWAEDRWKRPNLGLVLSTPGVYRGGQNRSVWLRRATHRREKVSTYRLMNVPSVPGPNPWHDVVYDQDVFAAVEALIGGPVNHVTGGLLFERGTQQGLHDDTWYGLGSNTPGGMVGVWFSFDDVDDDNGPVLYVRGSHRSDVRPEVPLHPAAKERREQLSLGDGSETDVMYEEMERRLPQAEPFHARAGDILVWHERLLHGGGAIRDWNRTRLSLVVHYRLD